MEMRAKTGAAPSGTALMATSPKPQLDTAAVGPGLTQAPGAAPAAKAPGAATSSGSLNSEPPSDPIRAWQVLTSGSVLLLCAIAVMVFFSQTFALGDDVLEFLIDQVTGVYHRTGAPCARVPHPPSPRAHAARLVAPSSSPEAPRISHRPSQRCEGRWWSPSPTGW